MAVAKPSKYRLKIYCLVPKCPNTVRNSPNKLFFSLPMDQQRRLQWYKAMKHEDGIRQRLSYVSGLHCCEDHFNVGVIQHIYMLY